MFNKPQSFQFIMDLAVAFPYYLHDDHQLPHTYSPYFSHDYIDYFAILPHEWLLSLPPISIQANPNFGDRPSGPNHHDIYREGANQVREIPLEDALDSEERNGDFCLEASRWNKRSNLGNSFYYIALNLIGNWIVI